MTQKITWTPIEIKLGDILVWGLNPKFSTKAQAQRLIDSEKKFGKARPFNVSPFILDADGKPTSKTECYDGHQRLAAWGKVYGMDYTVLALQCSRFLTEDERREFVIVLDHTAIGSLDWNALSGWDAEQLTGCGMDEDLLKTMNANALNLREMLTAESAILSLDELEKEYGTSADDDFYKVIRLKVSPEVFDRYTAIMKKISGNNDSEKIDALISSFELS